eukprot:TRINITY_DN900_c0_g2_i1.p1 TRINITY_DN900_c0_g2~~TRINITY_DN900_c0_g2_i1.p1  ORF type:complete len:834 (-),score=132.85 TRINITY_DN900_c0_g2_i1:94-2595(-)
MTEQSLGYVERRRDTIAAPASDYIGSTGDVKRPDPPSQITKPPRKLNSPTLPSLSQIPPASPVMGSHGSSSPSGRESAPPHSPNAFKQPVSSITITNLQNRPKPPEKADRPKTQFVKQDPDLENLSSIKSRPLKESSASVPSPVQPLQRLSVMPRSYTQPTLVSDVLPQILRSLPTNKRPPPISPIKMLVTDLNRKSKLDALKKNICEPSVMCSRFLEIGQTTALGSMGSHSVRRTGPSAFITSVDENLHYPTEVFRQQLRKVFTSCHPALQKVLQDRLLPPSRILSTNTFQMKDKHTTSVSRSFLTLSESGVPLVPTTSPEHSPCVSPVEKDRENSTSGPETAEKRSSVASYLSLSPVSPSTFPYNMYEQSNNNKRSSVTPLASPRRNEDLLEGDEQIAADLEVPDDLVDSEHIIFVVADDGTPAVKGGTVDKLIERLTYERLPSPDYMTSFLLTYRSFTTPIYLLEQLINRFNIAPPPESSPSYQAQFIKCKQKPIRLRVCNTLKYWTEKHTYDFAQDSELVKKLVDFLNNILAPNGFEKFASRIVQILEKKIPVYEQESQVKLPVMGMDPVSGSRLSLRGLGPRSGRQLLDYDPADVARQLTLLEFAYFRSIQPKECLNQAWNKSDRDVNAPNIINMIRRTNAVPLWVATEIVYSDRLKTRSKLIRYYISIAEKCRQFKNYNAVMEIISGLQLSAVHRLKRTWETIPKKSLAVFQELVDLMAVSNNWKNYREVLKQCNPPALPYLGMYLTDLTFLEDGSPDKLEGDMINFVKRTKVSLVIRNIQQYQQMPYIWESTVEIRDYLADMQWVDENQLWKMSLKCEPRVVEQPH